MDEFDSDDPWRLLFDENVRPAVANALRERFPGIDLTTVREENLLGTPDEELLELCVQGGRVFFSYDKQTMLDHLRRRAEDGAELPVLILASGPLSIGTEVEELSELLACSSPTEYVAGAVIWLPL